VIGRRQLPVASPISPAALLRALRLATIGDDSVERTAVELLRREFGAHTAALTDSGTSALVLALRLAVPPGGVVAYPSYACVDLAAAARFAGVRVRLYDLDPSTLGPDLDSVRAVLRRGVNAIVVAHLFGYGADVLGVSELAAASGVTVIEDAAQGAGGTVHARRLGSFGDLSVLSFGRGKGLCAGGGGALLGLRDPWSERLATTTVPAGGRGYRQLATTAVQWALGRPSLYALPSMLPWLRLGEMVYHPATEPSATSRASMALLSSAFDLEPADVESRRRTAAILDSMGGVEVARPLAIAGARSGYLRYAVRDLSGRRATNAALGIVRPYPRTLLEQHELRPSLMSDEPETPGATTLRRTLFALPTHRFVNPLDLKRIERWLSRAD
jgi:dTDP-4-amino-4,6-dideoxygalactose transaminase